MTPHQLRSICQENGLLLDAAQEILLCKHARELASWNAKINLISRQDESNILSRHILHSLTLRMPAICGYEFAGKHIADVGTGGGLPGIPLKIVTSSASVTLIDSIQKKIAVCNEMITSLRLDDIRGIAGRAEDLSKLAEYAQAFDAVVSRAVASLEDLTKWTHGLLVPGGTLFSLKGGDLSEEIKRTRRYKYVVDIAEIPLKLAGFDEFEQEGKKLVSVRFQN